MVGRTRVAAGSRRRAAAAIAALGLVTLVLRVVTAVLAEAPDFRWSLSPATLFFLHAAGMMLALLASNPTHFTPTGVALLAGHWHKLLYLFVLSVAVCSAVALASYALIESPFLRLRHRWAAHTGRG